MMRSRSLKIAGVAALAGMMMAAILAGLDRKPAIAPEIAVASAARRSDQLSRELDRCATLTMPDSGCESAWAEKRRQFFGQKDGTYGASSNQAALTDGSTMNEQALPELATSPAAERTRP